MRSHLQGKSYTRQSVANMQRRQFDSTRPVSYGWTVASVDQQYQLPVYQKDDALLMRHPAGDCWLLFHCGCWQPVDKHISELSENLETLKLTIEREIDNEEFSAAVQKLAA
jgi:hypothetical protein